jgi:trk system potassium uptake protein TrkH
MKRFLVVTNVVGLVVMLFGLTMLMPLGLAFFGGDNARHAYDESILATLAAGLVLWFATITFRRELQVRDGFLLVALVWAMLPAFATLPLMLYLPDLSFTDAYFETMSGMSTTGATVLSGLDNLPPSINLWRHELNWIGGMGIIVLAVAILPMLGVGGRQIYKAETPGPMKDSKLTPRITETAKGLWLVYTGITAACIVSLRLAGMSWFDAVCHAFAAMGLGGFSTHDASVGFFNSPVIEGVLIFFMLVAGMNFSTHFLAWRGKSLRAYLGDVECIALLLIVLGSCAGIGYFLWHNGVYGDYWTALRHASFNLVSIATDCGFMSVDYNQWPIFAPLWMLFLRCVVANSGSTGGGIKMIRTLILWKQAGREILKLRHPAAANPMKIGGQVIPNFVVVAVLGFIFVYFMSVATLTFLLVASGLDFISAFSAIIACINNAGPGLGKVGPAANYSVLSDFQTWVCSLAMLLGRLEVFTLLIVFTPSFWRK